MMERKPRNAMDAKIVMARVAIETKITVGSVFSPVSPAMPAAVGISSRPMTATIAPIEAGGKITSIQLVPMVCTMKLTIQKTIPTMMKPPSAAS